MRYYPVNLDLAGRPCAVIGGGSVAERKVAALRDAGAKVTVISPAVTAGLERMAAAGEIALVRRPYQPGDLAGFFLAVAAASDPEANRQAAREARARQVLINVADTPELCDFTVPAQMVRGELLLTVSTGGKSPALARCIREELMDFYGPEFGLFLDALAAIRAGAKAKPGTPGDREEIWRQALDRKALDLVRAGRLGEAEARVKDAVGRFGIKS